jgi:hypothetical protein
MVMEGEVEKGFDFSKYRYGDRDALRFVGLLEALDGLDYGFDFVPALERIRVVRVQLMVSDGIEIDMDSGDGAVPDVEPGDEAQDVILLSRVGIDDAMKVTKL